MRWSLTGYWVLLPNGDERWPMDAIVPSPFLERNAGVCDWLNVRPIQLLSHYRSVRQQDSYKNHNVGDNFSVILTLPNRLHKRHQLLLLLFQILFSYFFSASFHPFEEKQQWEACSQYSLGKRSEFCPRNTCWSFNDWGKFTLNPWLFLSLLSESSWEVLKANRVKSKIC